MRFRYLTFFLLLLLTIYSLIGNTVTDEISQTVVLRDNGHQVILANSYTPHDPIIITSDADFVTQGWPGNGTKTSPYLISGLNITSTGTCISIINTRAYFLITNSYIMNPAYNEETGFLLVNVTNCAVSNSVFDNHKTGIRLSNSYNNTMSNNTCKRSHSGFSLFHSDNNTLTNNSVNSCYDGFYITYSDNNTLEDNIVLDNGYSIRLEYSDNNTLTNNLVADSFAMGFYFVFSDWNTLTYNVATNISNGGFFFQLSHNNTLTHNTATNSLRGFYGKVSHYNSLTNNTAIANSYGFDFQDSYENKIYFNNIGSNVQNARDDEGRNQWDDGISYGNFWDDYNGSGVYEIPGTSSSVDRYPIFIDLVLPTIDCPADIEYEYGFTGFLITWFPSDLYPESYVIYQDESVVKAGAWNSTSETISISVDGLNVGVYKYTLVVYDTSSNTVSDTVIVTVVTITTTDTTTTSETTNPTTTINPPPSEGGILSLILMIGFSGGIVIILICIKKKS